MKVEQIEKVDRAIAKMIEMLGEAMAGDSANGLKDVILCVTGDHTTPVL